MDLLALLNVPFLEVKLAGNDRTGEFSGYGSTFGNVDLGKDRCVKGCFMRSLKEHKAGNSQPSMFWMHDKKLPIGDWMDVDEDDKGLMVKGKLWLGKGIPEAERAYCMLNGTGKKGLSIGYITKKATDQKNGVRDLEDVDLPEVSVVGHGMNPKALVTSIKAAFSGVPTARELEAFLLESTTLSNEQIKMLLDRGYKGLSAPSAEQTAQAEINQMLRLSRILRGEESC